MSIYFKNESHKAKRKYKVYETLTSIWESVDTNVFVGATKTYAPLSVTGVGLIVVPFSVGSACALSLGNKVIHKIIITKYNKKKGDFEKDLQTNKSF